MEKTVVALGFFDGVHLGHGALLRQAKAIAVQTGCAATAITLDRNPGKAMDGLLSTLEDRTDLMQRLYGIDAVHCAVFDRAFMHLSWQEFVTEYLCRRLHAAYVVCGYDYRFGYRGEGTPQKLQGICQDIGLGCQVVKKLTIDGQVVSSSLIRRQVAEGDMALAETFLGHPHQITGKVVSGQHLGRKLGMPTANLSLSPSLLLPQRGVYAVQAVFDGQRHIGVCNVGLRPTVGGHTPVAETWISDFHGDLYGKALRIEFYQMLRKEKKFPSLQALQQEVFRNRKQAEAYFAQRENRKASYAKPQ